MDVLLAFKLVVQQKKHIYPNGRCGLKNMKNEVEKFGAQIPKSEGDMNPQQ